MARVLTLFDHELGIPSSLAHTLHTLATEQDVNHSSSQIVISPTLPYDPEYSSEHQSFATADLPQRGLSLGFMHKLVRQIFEHSSDVGFDIKVLALSTDPASASVGCLRQFCASSRPVCALLLVRGHWILLHCTVIDSSLCITVYDGLGLDTSLHVQAVVSQLKMQWNVQHVSIEHTWILPQKQPHTCGSVALGHLLLLAQIITHEQAMHFESLHEGLVQCDTHQLAGSPSGFGPDDAVVETLEQILPAKGVPTSEVRGRAQAAIKIFGKTAVQKALDAKNVWSALKQLGNSRPKPFMWVTHAELEMHIQERATTKYGAQVDIKRSRKPSGKSAQAELPAIDPANLTLPPEVFVTNCGTPLPQLPLAGVVKNARGVAFVNAQDAHQYVQAGKFITPEGLALLIVGTVPDNFPQTLPMHRIRVPAIYKATGEPVLLECTSVQLGDQAVYQKTNHAAPELAVFPSVVFRAHVFKDLWSIDGLWNDLIEHPIRNLISSFPLMRLCKDSNCQGPCALFHPSIEEEGIESGLLDYWGFKWASLDGSKCSPVKSEVLSVYLRVPESSFAALHHASGHHGAFFEPRQKDSPAPDTRYAVLWVPQTSLADMVHHVKMHDDCLAVCRMGQKYGIRCLAKNHEALHALLVPNRPYVKCTVKMVYRLEPLPAGTQRQSLVSTLQAFGWVAKPLHPCPSSQGKAWLVGTEVAPPAQFIEAQHGWVSISKVRDQVMPSKPTNLIATARTKQHIKSTSQAVPATTADPWLQGADPWAGYETVSKFPAAAAPTHHVQQKFDEVEQKLQDHVATTVAQHLSQAEQASDSRIGHVEAQIQTLVDHQTKLQQWIQDGSAQIQDLRRDQTQIHQALQYSTVQSQEHAEAIAGLASDLSVCNQTLATQGHALQSVAQDLSGLKDSLGHSGPSSGFVRVPGQQSTSCRFPRLWTFFAIFACFLLRIGEATVPGPAVSVDSFLDDPQWAFPEIPQFCLGVANPSGISNKLHMLGHLPIGLWHFAETQASFHQQCQVRKHLKTISYQQERNIRCIMGAPAALRPGSVVAGSWTGVMCFGDCPLRHVPHVWPSDEYTSGRVALSVAHVGSLAVSMATVYCPAKGPTFPRAKALAEELLQPVTQTLVLSRAGPRAIVGDFNHKAGSLDQTKIWQQHGWIELQDYMFQTYGVAPQNTCKFATAPDQMWLSPELALLISNVAVWDIFPDHAVLVAGVRVPQLPRYQLQWRLPGHIPWDHLDSEYWLSAPDIGPFLGTDFQHVGCPESVDQTQSTQAFRSWSQRFEERAAASLQSGTVRADTSFRGRGALDRPQLRLVTPSVPKHSRSGEVSQVCGFLNRSVSRWFKQLRRLQSYLHAIKSDRVADNYLSRVSLWRSILVSAGFQGGFRSWWCHRPFPSQGSPVCLPEVPPSLEIAQLIYDDFLQHYRRYEHWQQRKRYESGVSKLQSSTRGLFAATRKPPKDQLDCLEDSHRQQISVVDAQLGLVEVPEPFPSSQAILWTLQDAPAVVSQSAHSDTTYVVDSDLLLVDGQTLECKVLIHDVHAIHDRLSQLWSPRWLKHTDTPSVRWDHICAFADQHLPKGNISLPEVTLEDWKKAVRSFHLLQKKDTSSQANGFRPITVMSLFYRVYAGLRAGQLLHQLALLSDAMQCGFMKSRQAADVWYFVGVCVEVSLQQNLPVHGWVADLVMAYNTLPRHPTFFFLKCIGVPSWFLHMWESHLTCFERFFVVNRITGPCQMSSTGFPEGCPLACVAMAAVDLVWHLFHTSQVPRTIPLSFVDNLEVISDKIPELLASHDALLSFCHCLDLELDLPSFYAWSSSSSGRGELRSHGFPTSLGQRDLGGQVTYCKQLRNKVLQDRIAQTIPYFAKLRSCNLSTAACSANIRQVLWPRALHGCESAILGEQHFRKLRAQAMRALKWDRAGASPLVRLSLCHLELDPEWYQLWRVVQMFRTQLAANSILADWWKLFGQGLAEDTSNGPFGKVLALLEEIHMTIDEDLTLWFSEQGYVRLPQCADSVLRDILAMGYQRHVCDAISTRTGYEGLDGFDYETTTWVDPCLTAAELEQIHIVRDGSFFTNHAKSKWDTSVSPLCSWCQKPDTRSHRYTECAKYDGIRAQHQELFREWTSYPACFQNHGLVPENPWRELLTEAKCQLPCLLRDFQFQPEGDVIHAFTDGTCTDPMYSSISLAAWSVVIAHKGVLASGPLTGIQQCIFRAELSAVLSVLIWVQNFCGCLHIWCDNQAVVDMFRDIQRGTLDLTNVEHEDLWRQVHDLIHSVTARVFIHKVYSHDDEASCASPLEDFCRFWNNCADRQAAVANQSRPRYFDRVFQGFVGYRNLWRRRVQLFIRFALAIAAYDCEGIDEDFDEDCAAHQFPVFDTAVNTVQIAPLVLALAGRRDLFSQVHSHVFQTVFHQLAAWLAAEDTRAATMRKVSLLELYVGFRLSQPGKLPLISGGGVDCRFTVITFAVDYSFFKKVFTLLAKSSGPGSLYSFCFRLPYVTQCGTVEALRKMEEQFGFDHASALVFASGMPNQMLTNALNRHNLAVSILQQDLLKNAVAMVGEKYHGRQLEAVAAQMNGVGKTHYIHRQIAKLQEEHGGKALLHHVEIRETTDISALVQNLLSDPTDPQTPTAVHIDLAHILPSHVDTLLFELLIVGMLRDTHLCRVYHRRAKKDFFFIEIPNTPGESTAKQLSFCLILPRVYLSMSAECLDGEMPVIKEVDGAPLISFQKNELLELVGKTLEAMRKEAFNPKSRHFDVTWTGAKAKAIDLPRTYELLEEVCSSETSPPSFLVFMNLVKFLGHLIKSAEEWNMMNLALLQNFDPGLKHFKHCFFRLLIETSRDFALRQVPKAMDTTSPSILAPPTLPPHLGRGVSRGSDGAPLPPDLLRNLSGMSGGAPSLTRKTSGQRATPSLQRQQSRAQQEIAAQHEADAKMENTGVGRIDASAYVARFDQMPSWESCIHPVANFKKNDRGAIIGCNIMSLQRDFIGNFIDRSLQNSLNLNDLKLDRDWSKVTHADAVALVHQIEGGALLQKKDHLKGPKDYVVTVDNLIKLMSIQQRLKYGLPVILMGETGCGKTALVKFLAETLDFSLFTLDIHGGITDASIVKFLEDAIAKADHERGVLVFFDEINAANCMALFKTIIIDRMYGNKVIPENVRIISCCNPYRKRRNKELEDVALVYSAAAGDAASGISDPMKELVYRVHPLPESLIDVVSDFGSLSEASEEIYIKAILKKELPNKDADGAEDRQAQAAQQGGQVQPPIADEYEVFISSFCELLCQSQNYVREVNEGERSVVSMRDIGRAARVFKWFLTSYSRLHGESASAAVKDEKDGTLKIDVCAKLREHLRRALVLTMGYCYHSRLNRDQRWGYRKRLCETWERLRSKDDGAMEWLKLSDANELNKMLIDTSYEFVSQMDLGEGIALNEALRENLFMLLVSVMNQIPILLIGKPGCSKSLAMGVLQNNLNGEVSSRDFFKSMPAVDVFAYQCSPLSTPDAILNAFHSARQSNLGHKSTIVCVLLDEVGLAEESPHLPLKVLHKELEDLRGIACVGISNWALDAAKMSRCVTLYRPPPTVADLSVTAQGMVQSENLKSYLKALSEAFAEIYKRQKRADFWGMREFYSTVRVINAELKIRAAAGLEAVLEEKVLMKTVQRNFGGQPEEQLEACIEEFFERTGMDFGDVERLTTQELIKQNLEEPDARHLMLLTKNNAALRLLFEGGLLDHSRAEVMFGSTFPNDLSDMFVAMNLQRIKSYMQQPVSLVMVHCDSLYESLYDLLNQHYMEYAGQRYVRIAHGSKAKQCPIHKLFRVIVVTELSSSASRWVRHSSHFLGSFGWLDPAGGGGSSQSAPVVGGGASQGTPAVVASADKTADQMLDELIEDLNKEEAPTAVVKSVRATEAAGSGLVVAGLSPEQQRWLANAAEAMRAGQAVAPMAAPGPAPEALAVVPVEGQRPETLELPKLTECTAVEFGDWLAVITPLMSDLNSTSASWWSLTMAAAQRYYELWRIASPLDRLRL
eukprot:s2426_g1.t1